MINSDMSLPPSALNAKASCQSSQSTRKLPEAYWITFDQQLKDQSALTSSQGNPVQNPKEEQSLHGQQVHLLNQNEQSLQSKHKIIKILAKISEQYATYRFLDWSCQLLTNQHIEQIVQKIRQQQSKYKLTKRSLVFAILVPSRFSLNIQRQICASPYFSKMIHFHSETKKLPSEPSSNSVSPQNSPTKKLRLSRNASIIVGNTLFISLKKNEEQIEKQLIKNMKLDFIWLGIMSRIGADVQKFRQQIIQQEDFSPEYIGFYEMFFSQLNLLLRNKFLTENQTQVDCEEKINQEKGNNQFQASKQQQSENKYKSVQSHNQSKQVKASKIDKFLLTKLLQISKQKCTLRNPEISAHTQQLIRSKFNSRVVISDVTTSGDYLTLLLSRNYFNLLYIECNTMVRFENFKENCQQAGLQHLRQILNLEVFLTLDDYWYRNFILNCIPHVKFIIDRGDQSVHYSQVIEKNYRQIIPSYRPNFDEYFISICNVLKVRSGCLKQAVGSIIVKDKRIIATGYNGTPVDSLNCFNGGCKVCNNSQKMNTQVLSCTCIHAQYGCILQAGIRITPGSTLYSTKLPCLWCCKLIIQGNIKKIVFLRSKYSQLEYQNIDLSKQILKQADIQLVQLDESKIYISV